MLKIQYCSDLHLEFRDNQNFLKDHPLQPVGEILLLAGDIMPLGMLDKYNDFIDYLADSFEAVYWIPGNHEYYHYDLAKKAPSFKENLRPNVSLLNNQQVDYKGVNLIFSTLWSKISPRNEWIIQQNVSDFSLIKVNGKPLTATIFNAMHTEALEFISLALNSANGAKTIVCTHHVPTLMNYPEKYKNDPINEAFATELYEFIEKGNADYWIYGHHHANTEDFSIGRTQMLTNQLGYVKYKENEKFNSLKVIDI